MKKQISFLLVLLLIVGAGLFLMVPYQSPASPAAPSEEFSVIFLDVGQGDAALLGSGDHWMLIDGGGRDSSQKIYAALKQRNITHLELVIASHPHEDHIGGLSAAFQAATVDRVLCSTDTFDSKSFENLKRYAQEKSTSITVPQAGDCFFLGNAKVEILGLNVGPTENACSIITKVTHGNQSFLFPGDMEAEYLPPDWDLSATVLKVSHHGSRTGTNRDFLSRTSAKYAVLSLGKDNLYAMPHETVLSLLKENCCAIYRTDLQGDITFLSDGTRLQVTTQKNAANRALFTPGDGTPPSGVTAIALTYSYVINTGTMVFHSPYCASVEQMKEINKRFSTETRDTLISSGYKPCGNCKP